VVVHKVVDWTVADHRRGTPVGPLPEHWEPVAPDELDEALGNHDLMSLFAELPARAREVLQLRYLLGLEIEEIAQRLGIQRNAVDAALHRGHEKLREALATG
jgi:RNA polymerase sigma factor (sigma-70 family)